MIFWLVLKLEIGYNRVIIYLEGFGFLLEDYIAHHLLKDVLLELVGFFSLGGAGFVMGQSK
jgi:hypothetical protein